MPNSSRTSPVLAGIAGAVMLIGAGFAEAQAQEQPQPQPPMPAELSQSQIETFADAAIEVQRLQQEFDTQAQAAENAEEIEQLQQQAQEQARQAIEEQGLSVDEYTAILQAANQDPQLYAMIVETMEQRAQ